MEHSNTKYNIINKNYKINTVNLTKNNLDFIEKKKKKMNQSV